MSDLTPFTLPETDKLAGLVFELAEQLHIERQRRMALEAVLVKAGVIAAGAADSLAGDAAFLTGARAELDRSIRKLLRVVTEAGDAKTPLRAEAPADAPGR